MVMDPEHLTLYVNLEHELQRTILRMHTTMMYSEANARDWQRVWRLAQKILALTEAIHSLVGD